MTNTDGASMVAGLMVAGARQARTKGRGESDDEVNNGDQSDEREGNDEN